MSGGWSPAAVFDAIMIAYNILGYHLLSYPPPADHPMESLSRNQQEIFPLCREHDVGVMIMKPLAGGLLCASKAFPPRPGWHHPPATTAGDILRSILVNPEVACVMPGTASIEEAEENALCGHAPIALLNSTASQLTDVVTGLKATVCSRCGKCDTLCSQQLPVSSMFWAVCSTSILGRVRAAGQHRVLSTASVSGERLRHVSRCHVRVS
jgi:predicted aldo/keto reductase-like oxidoreductase